MKKIKSLSGIPQTGIASFKTGGRVDPTPKGQRVVKGSAASYYQDPEQRKIAESLGAIKDYGEITREQYLDALDHPDKYPNDHPLVSSYGTYQSMRKEFRDNPTLRKVSVGELYDTKIPNRPFGASDVGPNIYQRTYQDPVTDVSSGPIYAGKPEVEQPLKRTNPVVYGQPYYNSYNKPGTEAYKKGLSLINNKKAAGGSLVPPSRGLAVFDRPNNFMSPQAERLQEISPMDQLNLNGYNPANPYDATVDPMDRGNNLRMKFGANPFRRQGSSLPPQKVTKVNAAKPMKLSAANPAKLGDMDLMNRF